MTEKDRYNNRNTVRNDDNPSRRHNDTKRHRDRKSGREKTNIDRYKNETETDIVTEAKTGPARQRQKQGQI